MVSVLKLVKKILFPFTICLSAMLFMSCGLFQSAGSGSEAGNSSRIALLSDSLLIRIPTSATGDSSTILSKKSEYRKETLRIYELIRGYIGFANELVQNEQIGLKKLIKTFRDSLPWEEIERVSSVTGVNDGLIWRALYDGDEEFRYRMSAALPAKPSEPVFTLIFNGSESEPEGRAYYRFDLLEHPKEKQPLKVEVTFKTISGIREMNVRVDSDSILGDSDEGFRKLSLQMIEKDGILHLSGGSYHPRLLNLIPDTTEYCYEFYCVSDIAQNRSVLHVGLPPASIDNDDFSLLSKYGIASVFARKIIREDIKTLNDTLKRCIVTSYSDSMAIKEIFDSMLVSGPEWLHPASEIADMTVEDLFYFIEINRNYSDPGFLSLLVLLELAKQPAYFDRSGYVANGERVPDGFHAITAANRLLGIQSPLTIKTLSVLP